jgi:hypothetical protein
VEFVAVSNKTYTLEFNDSLNPAAWFPLTDLPAANTNRLHTLTDSNAAPFRAYRLVTPRSP